MEVVARKHATCRGQGPVRRRRLHLLLPPDWPAASDRGELSPGASGSRERRQLEVKLQGLEQTRRLIAEVGSIGSDNPQLILRPQFTALPVQHELTEATPSPGGSQNAAPANSTARNPSWADSLRSILRVGTGRDTTARACAGFRTDQLGAASVTTTTKHFPGAGRKGRRGSSLSQPSHRPPAPPPCPHTWGPPHEAGPPTPGE